MKRNILLLIFAICLGIVVGNIITQKLETGLPFTKASGERIQLVNNPSSHDTSWDELKTFVADDKTEKTVYSESSFICGDFAEMLHNNAERAGIKAAVVIVGFADNSTHAINAFDTIDEGLIYIDDTGADSGEFEGRDKVAYVVDSKEYGLIKLDDADSFDYAFYVNYNGDYFYPTLGTVIAIELFW